MLVFLYFKYTDFVQKTDSLKGRSLLAFQPYNSHLWFHELWPRSSQPLSTVIVPLALHTFRSHQCLRVLVGAYLWPYVTLHTITIYIHARCRNVCVWLSIDSVQHPRTACLGKCVVLYVSYTQNHRRVQAHAGRCLFNSWLNHNRGARGFLVRKPMVMLWSECGRVRTSCYGKCTQGCSSRHITSFTPAPLWSRIGVCTAIDEHCTMRVCVPEGWACTWCGYQSWEEAREKQFGFSR